MFYIYMCKKTMHPLQLLYILVYIPDFIGHVLADNLYQFKLLKGEVVKFK